MSRKLQLPTASLPQRRPLDIEVSVYLELLQSFLSDFTSSAILSFCCMDEQRQAMQ